MIPNLETTTLDTNISAPTHAFTIELTPTLAKLLSSQTYPNKILAAIREPLSNAYDAHVRAGTLDIPARLHLPTILEPFFALRDYGTGLSHDDVIRLFFSYGASDKRESNTEIGGLGIGAKAFFAYTDQAVITSYFNGEKRVYSAHKNPAGLPQGMLLSTEPTNEPNGIELHYAADGEDRHARRFLSHVESLLVYLPLKVTCNVPLDPPRPRVLYQTTVMDVPVEVPYGRQNKVVMGGIAYDVPEHVWQPVSIYPFILHLPIGRIEISASRESLSPTEADITYLRSVLTELKDHLCRENWGARIDDCPDWLSACKLRNLMVEILGLSIFTATAWRGRNITGHFPEPGTDYASAAVAVWRRKNKKLEFSSLHYRDFNKTVARCYWIPTGKRLGWRAWYQKERGMEHNDIDLVLMTDTLERAQELAAVIGITLPVLDGSECRVRRQSTTRSAPAAISQDHVWTAGGLQAMSNLDTERLVFCSPRKGLATLQNSLDNLWALGVMLYPPIAFSGYNLTETRAQRRYASYPTSLKDWLARHPDAIKLDVWHQKAFATQLFSGWRPNWINPGAIRSRESLYKFPVQLDPAHFNSQSYCFVHSLSQWLPMPDVQAELDAIRQWHNTVFPTLPAPVRSALQGFTVRTSDLHQLYQELSQ
jgi:hypothetical protein